MVPQHQETRVASTFHNHWIGFLPFYKGSLINIIFPLFCPPRGLTEGICRDGNLGLVYVVRLCEQLFCDLLFIYGTISNIVHIIYIYTNSNVKTCPCMWTSCVIVNFQLWEITLKIIQWFVITQLFRLHIIIWYGVSSPPFPHDWFSAYLSPYPLENGYLNPLDPYQSPLSIRHQGLEVGLGPHPFTAKVYKFRQPPTLTQASHGQPFGLELPLM